MVNPLPNAATLVSVNVARAQACELLGRRVMTAIGKRAAEGPVAVRPLGLEGDEQADLSVHGGLSKAVYAYPLEHYPVWQTLRAQAGAAGWDTPLAPGAMGENFSLRGLLENQVCVGDVLRFADCELVVSEPRFPCFKFNHAMGFKQAAKMMAQSGFCGFYLAVKTPGRIAAGERFALLPGPREVGIAELFRDRAHRITQ
jgi:MOSC domain-containing protein YiiM